MSKPFYTPGPWALRGVQVRAGNGLGKHIATYQVTESDGSLIAAAPELFEALVALVDCQPTTIAPFGKLHAAMEMARDALAKARHASRYALPPDEEGAQ